MKTFSLHWKYFVELIGTKKPIPVTTDEGLKLTLKFVSDKQVKIIDHSGRDIEFQCYNSRYYRVAIRTIQDTITKTKYSAEYHEEGDSRDEMEIVEDSVIFKSV